MRRIVTFTVALALLPALVAAQQNLPTAQTRTTPQTITLPTLSATLPTHLGSPAPAWVQGQPHIGAMPNMQVMQRHFSEMHAMQLQTRGAILAALTPAHRASLSQLVGNLAVAPTPDAASAARQLDMMLSRTEGRAVVTAERNFQTQVQAVMQNAIAQSMTSHAMVSAHATASGFAGGDDAGQILLRYAAMGMMPMPNMLIGPGQQPHR